MCNVQVSPPVLFSKRYLKAEMLSGEFDSNGSRVVLARKARGRNEHVNTITSGADSDSIVISLRNLWEMGRRGTLPSPGNFPRLFFEHHPQQQAAPGAVGTPGFGDLPGLLGGREMIQTVGQGNGATQSRVVRGQSIRLSCST